MKIAVVGAGGSGLVAAHRLTAQGHDVSVFESSDRWGGHAHSISLESEGVRGPVETGFLVFNEGACPHLTALLAELDSPTREIRMAYEIRNPGSKMVLRGRSLRELISVPSNLSVPSFYRVVPDWIRFTRQARKILQGQRALRFPTLREFLDDGAYSDDFIRQFIYPLAGAVYPLPREALAEMPPASLLGFIHNHGLLSLTRGLGCRMLTDGSRGYLDRLTEPFRERIHLDCPVSAIARHDDYVVVKFPHRSRERFEQVVLAVHADVALRLLADPTRHERQVLESFDYATQNVYLHLEDPRQRPSRAPATWSFQPSSTGSGGVRLSFRVSHVQGVDAPEALTFSMLGADQPPPPRLVRTICFRRPVFSAESVLAQRRLDSISGPRRTFFCGSYWGNGFHEDAVRSAEDAVKRLMQRSPLQLATCR